MLVSTSFLPECQERIKIRIQLARAAHVYIDSHLPLRLFVTISQKEDNPALETYRDTLLNPQNELGYVLAREYAHGKRVDRLRCILVREKHDLIDTKSEQDKGTAGPPTIE